MFIFATMSSKTNRLLSRCTGRSPRTILPRILDRGHYPRANFKSNGKFLDLKGYLEISSGSKQFFTTEFKRKA